LVFLEIMAKRDQNRFLVIYQQDSLGWHFWPSGEEGSGCTAIVQYNTPPAAEPRKTKLPPPAVARLAWAHTGKINSRYSDANYGRKVRERQYGNGDDNTGVKYRIKLWK
jgi:hypothetical protein